MHDEVSASIRPFTMAYKEGDRSFDIKSLLINTIADSTSEETQRIVM